MEEFPRPETSTDADDDKANELAASVIPLEGISLDPPSEGDDADVIVRQSGPLTRIPRAENARAVTWFYALATLASVLYWRSPWATLLPASGEAVFGRGEWWRVVTALVAHADPGHLLANAPLILIFGWLLRAYFGLGIFPGLAIALGVLTNVLTIYFYPPGVQLVGASGMAFAMVGLWLVLYLRFDTDRSLVMRGFRALGFALLMLVPSTVEPRVSYLAHGIGFALGVASGLLLATFIHVRDPSRDENGRSAGE